MKTTCDLLCWSYDIVGVNASCPCVYAHFASTCYTDILHSNPKKDRNIVHHYFTRILLSLFMQSTLILWKTLESFATWTALQCRGRPLLAAQLSMRHIYIYMQMQYNYSPSSLKSVVFIYIYIRQTKTCLMSLSWKIMKHPKKNETSWNFPISYPPFRLHSPSPAEGRVGLANEAHAGALCGRLEGRIDAIGLRWSWEVSEVRNPQIIQSSWMVGYNS